MGWIRSRIGNGPSRKAHGPFPHDLTFFNTDITYLGMTPIFVLFDISRWREYYASGVGCY